jgi:CheY-like chemotaxis protein
MIDDNPIEHLIMQKMFGKFNLFPDAVFSLDAKTMIEFIERYHLVINELPDVIFLDLNIPEYTGWDFLEDFNRLYRKIKKPVDIYIISSSIVPKDKSLLDLYPFVKGCISKPIKMETLLSLHSIYQSTTRIAS